MHAEGAEVTQKTQKIQKDKKQKRNFDSTSSQLEIDKPQMNILSIFVFFFSASSA
jgi:hypothetical protein